MILRDWDDRVNYKVVVYYKVSELEALIPTESQILETSLYEEMEENDSICLVIKQC